MTDAELLPCPFCGGTRVVVTCTAAGPWWFGTCDCQAEGPPTKDGEAAAIAAWNRRAPGSVDRRGPRRPRRDRRAGGQAVSTTVVDGVFVGYDAAGEVTIILETNSMKAKVVMPVASARLMAQRLLTIASASEAEAAARAKGAG
jgi:Lar family restriction alleviation protein